MDKTSNPQFSHKSMLSDLGVGSTFSKSLEDIHALLKQKYPFIARVAIALYDKKSDLLKTFAYSSEDKTPLSQYESKLAGSASLLEVIQHHSPRVVNDMSIYAHAKKQHSNTLAKVGFSASYTYPMFYDGNFIGFIFFNSPQKDVFNERVLRDIDISSSLITLMIVNLKSTVKTLTATVKSAQTLTHHRDPETGCHLERMSRYSRLIAQKLASNFNFDDEFIEHIFLFSPLHDVGKIAISDSILLKPEPLTDQEFYEMRTHPQKGLEIIDNLILNFGLNGVKHIEVLRNIVCHHHELKDGSGYPENLKGNDIPIEARIVTVADIFDALTSKRPYKNKWTNEQAFAELTRLANSQLDEDCVNALLACIPEIEAVQSQFLESNS